MFARSDFLLSNRILVPHLISIDGFDLSKSSNVAVVGRTFPSVAPGTQWRPGGSFRIQTKCTLYMFLVQICKVNRKKTRWLNISCHKQQDVGESGYYTCQYMREIMDHECGVIPINCLRGSPETYKELIDELREE